MGQKGQAIHLHISSGAGTADAVALGPVHRMSSSTGTADPLAVSPIHLHMSSGVGTADSHQYP